MYISHRGMKKKHLNHTITIINHTAYKNDHNNLSRHCSYHPNHFVQANSADLETLATSGPRADTLTPA